MYNPTNRYAPPVCVCGHAENLHKFGKIDCNGTVGAGFLNKGRKCYCLLFTDVNPANHVPFARGEAPKVITPQEAIQNSTTNASAVQPIALPSSKPTRTREEIEALLARFKEELEKE